MEQHLIFQVCGANTDVGKTLVATGLLRACAAFNQAISTSYIKPIQTGVLTDSETVTRYTNGVGCKTLFSWQTAVSPHLAARKERQEVSDQELVEALQQSIDSLPANSVCLVETAGGVLSPAPSGPASAQADVYRPLRLPVILVADGTLGGISASLASYEALISRGYDIYAIVSIECKERLDNLSAIVSYLDKTLGHKHTPSLALPVLPDRSPGSLEHWFEDARNCFAELWRILREKEHQRRQREDDLVSKAANMFWYPFTPHQCHDPAFINVLDSAYGSSYLIAERTIAKGRRKRSMLDGCASWWTQGIGHGRPSLSLAIAEAAGRYGHVIFPGNVHEPALRLTELMLEGPGNGWATRLFFSDNGSTAMEISLKIALRRAAASGVTLDAKSVAVITQQGCYHGDTLGCMDAAGPSVFNMGQHPWCRPRTLSLSIPRVSWINGQLVVEVPRCPVAPTVTNQSVPFPGGMASLLDVLARESSDLSNLYRQAIRAHIAAFESKAGAPRLAALLLEPVLLGAAGMVMVDPLFQRILVQEARRMRLPVVFDEVASGLYRLGRQSAAELLKVSPDIASYGKTLTGGYLPLAVTLTTEEVFNAFRGPSKSDALMHGHSYTANPLSCAAAVRALETYQAQGQFEEACDHGNSLCMQQSAFADEDAAELSRISIVRSALAVGTVLAVELDAQGRGGESSLAAARIVGALRDEDILARPLGNVVYLMVSQVDGTATVQHMTSSLKKALLEYRDKTELQSQEGRVFI